ncbi:MAG TPA: arylesterase [Vicinamibacterales bacterium]|nr:arylesterase [Vicinamibacterales bacterium]
MHTRRSLLVLVCLLALVAGCRGNGSDDRASKEPQPAAAATSPTDGAPERPKIVALGDSLTAGLGLVESQAYPALLQAKLNAEGYALEVVNAGVSGDTSAGGLRRLDWALQGDVRVLVLALGANDGLRGLSVAEMKNNLVEIIRRARERNIVVILAGMEAPPNYGAEYTASFRRAFQDVAREQRVIFLPFLLVKVAGDPALNQGDGIHPNAAGAAIIADTLWQVIRPVLDQMSARP